jgi:hypothetical protein
MLSKSVIQFAGEYLLEDSKILSVSGSVFDIKDLIEEISIYEDIFTVTVSGSITFTDTNNIIKNFPIVGEERLVLKLATPQEKESPDTTIDYTRTPLIITNVSHRNQMNSNAQLVTLKFTSLETYRDNICRVSQSYKGQPSDILEKILRDKSYLASTKRLFKEETANNMKVVFPNMRPFDCIQHLMKRSNSASNVDSPTYLFYETTKGFHFRTFDGLCNDEVAQYFRESVGGQLDEKGTSDPQKNLETIVNYEINSNKDTANQMRSGAYSSKLITHDVYNKKLNTYKYDYLSNFDKDIHPDNGESKPIISRAIDPDLNKSITEHEDTKLYVVSTASGYSFSEGENYPYQSDNLNRTLQRRKGRIQQFGGGIILNLEIAGNTAIKVGDKIGVEINNQSNVDGEDIDKELSGNFIVTTLRHVFTQSKQLKHKIVMQVMKDSRLGDTLPSTGISNTDGLGIETGTSETIRL